MSNKKWRAQPKGYYDPPAPAATVRWPDAKLEQIVDDLALYIAECNAIRTEPIKEIYELHRPPRHL